MKSHILIASVVAIALVIAAAPAASAATRYVAVTGTDGPSCGIDALSACRSIGQAIINATPGDTILVGPGRYGDLNLDGFLGGPGEERGAPGCGCVLALNKNVILVSSGGAAVTMIDGRTVDVQTNVLLITVGGEFGRPGKGFYVTDTARYNGSYYESSGIVIDSENVLVRGNQVFFSRTAQAGRTAYGIITVNDAPLRIEGNQVTGWYVGISGRGAAIISKNQVVGNRYVGIASTGGDVVGNVVTGTYGHGIAVYYSASVTTNAVSMNGNGIYVGAPFNGSVTKNNLSGNRCALINDGVYVLQAPNNYWGRPEGPGVSFDRICDWYTPVTPVATKPFVVKVLKP